MAFNKEKVMDAARKFVDRGQIDKAVKEYLRIVHEDPKDVRVWLKIGDLYAKKGSKQDATDTYLKVARFYHDQGFLHKAVAVYKQILKLDPRLVDVILKLAELYRQLGLMSDAMQHYESVAAHFHREGKTKEALETVKRLVDLDPENIATRIKLAELYSKEGLVEEASSEFSIACEQLRRQNRQDDFLKVAERLLWHKPENHSLNRELAGLYLRRSDPRRALQKLQACFKADPRDVDTLGLLAQAFQALDQKAKTVSVLKELARIHVENKARERAGSVFRKIIEFVPNDPDAIAFLGPQAAPRAALPRPATPLPPAVRAATSDAKFNITGDLPAIPPSSRMTGSMPLVDEQSLSGVDFALPEYDDADFSADMEPPPDPRRASAAGERHSDEISKILAETDVYVKYGLHQKAVDHLRRVFTLDTENVEAHERLKDILISQGREQEAEVELLKLAELIAPADPDRAEAYLQELLAMNGTHTGAFELARRFRLRVARMSSVSAEVEYAGGGVAAIDGDLDLDDLDLSSPPRAIAVARAPSPQHAGRSNRRDSIDDFDPAELLGQVASGSPAPSRPPVRPGGINETGDFELEFSPSSQSTKQISAAHAEALAQLGNDTELAADDLDDEIADAPPGNWQEPDEEAIAVDIEASAADEDLPFDRDAAREFDAHVYDQGGSEVPGIDATPIYTDAEALEVSGSFDPYNEPEVIESPAPFEQTAMNAPISGEPAARSETSVEDELDTADFYTSQGMYSEAYDVLRALQATVPTHPLVASKLAELEPLVHGAATPAAGNPSAPIAAAIDHEAVHMPEGTDALELDDIEEVDAEDLEEVAADADSGPGGGPVHKRRPTVMLEKPVEEGDADTHYDLGLAYKEMGLYDEAIKAFEKVLRAPGREVQCRVMIGMCQREQGNPSEAIHQLKQGLHAEPSDRERLSLYYEIGITYEAIGDDSEALYYFETVVKRDATFADAGARATELRSRGGKAPSAHDDL